jgi:hypothetical protein
MYSNIQIVIWNGRSGKGSERDSLIDVFDDWHPVLFRPAAA